MLLCSKYVLDGNTDDSGYIPKSMILSSQGRS